MAGWREVVEGKAMFGKGSVVTGDVILLSNGRAAGLYQL
jgi:hypothetical protein